MSSDCVIFFKHLATESCSEMYLKSSNYEIIVTNLIFKMAE
jgi:hypothetical protein